MSICTTKLKMNTVAGIDPGASGVHQMFPELPPGVKIIAA